MLQSQRICVVAVFFCVSVAVAGCGVGAAGTTPDTTPTQRATPLPTAAATVTPVATPVPGERVVFGVRGDGWQVFSQLPDGSDYRQVTTGPGNHICATLSPDAKTIAYCGDASGAFEIWTVRPDGSNDTQLTTLGGQALFPAFSPDGTKIAFSGREGTDPNVEIYVVNAQNGTGLRALTSCAGGKPGCANVYPSWSPDGTKIVYAHQDDGDPEGGFGTNEQVWVVNSDGSHAHALTTGPESKDQRPKWSPDGTSIVYASGPLQSEGIWVMRADGTKPTQLTGCNAGDAAPCAAGSDFAPTWSPDGTHIAFLRDFGATGKSDRPVLIMRADGSDQRRLSPDSTVAAVPDWR